MPHRMEDKTGLVRPTAAVAMTAARAVTSHARKRYHERYRRSYRFARLVFAFDTGLLALALGLLVLNIVLFAHRFERPIGLDLRFVRGEIVASSLTPLEAVIRPTDALVHEDVRISWELPPGAEIVRADPALSNGTAYLGRIDPGTEAVSRIYVRIRDRAGTSIPFGFVVQDGVGTETRRVTGGESVRVSSSALTAETALPVQGVEPGGSVPIVVRNSGPVAASSVIVRLTKKDGAPASGFGTSDEAIIGELLPGAARTIFLDVDPEAADEMDFAWEVQDAARAVSFHAFHATAADPVRVRLQEPLRSTPGAASTNVSYESDAAAKLWVVHPLQESGDAGRFYDLARGEGSVFIPFKTGARTDETVWWALPYEVRNGRTVVGRRVIGVLSTAFAFDAEARYYSTLGDQLGIGPLPPRIGEATSYWIIWSIGPTDADLSDIELSGALPANVRATGRYASLVPGEFVADGSSVRWSVPSLPATGDAQATFAFEVELIPGVAQRGSVPSLLGTSRATATEVRSGLGLAAQDGSLDANLSDDVQARGMGRVE